MRISQKTEYALRAVFELSLAAPKELVKTAHIADRHGIPSKFLELILSNLKQGGFVEARRGAEGGYRLSRPPDAITVGDVVRFMEVPSEPRSPSDPFADLWHRLQETTTATLDSLSFEDLARTHRQTSEREASVALSWQI